MKPFDFLAALPQFVSITGAVPELRTLLNVQTGCHVRERQESPGLVLASAGGVAVLEGAALAKYMETADLLATMMAAGRR